MTYSDLPFTIEQASKSGGKFNGVANGEEISRSGHFIQISGIDVSYYNQTNPVVLACHTQMGSNLMPGAIGVMEKVIKSKTELKFRGLQFDSDELSQIWAGKVQRGVIRMLSVGIIPMEWDIEEETIGKGKSAYTIRYISISKCELIEISVCPVGANRQSLIGNVMARDQQDQIADLETKVKELAELLSEIKNVDNGSQLKDIVTEEPGGQSAGNSLNDALDKLKGF